jgi:hypothetical protein
MSHKFLFNASFHFLLNSIDQEFAIETQKKGCPYCGNKLHQANYPRSPFGMLSPFRHYYDERLSFCCDSCRKRTTPQSVRFFGRHWYPAPFLMLISALTLGINERRLLQVKRHFGIVVSESTWKRWRRWWRDSFITTAFWRKERSLIPTVIETKKTLPRALLNVFQGVLEEKMRYLLRFLSPLNGGVLRAV